MNKTLHWLFVAAVCDYCGSPVVEIEPKTGKTLIHPMVCAYGLTLCLECADLNGVIVKAVLSGMGRTALPISSS